MHITETESPLNHLTKLEASDRAAYLESSKEIENAYAQAAQKGRSEAPSAQDEVDHHYICLVKSPGGHLYELDGDQNGPISRAPLKEEEDVLAGPGLDILRRYIGSGKDGRFGLLALVDC